MSNSDDEKKLKFEAEEIDQLLQKVKDGNLAVAISVVSIEGGHRVTINSKSFDVMDGTDANVTAENIAKALGYVPAKNDDIPKSLSDLNNDTGYIDKETDPTVPDWAKTPEKPIYTASEVGAEPANAVSAHNTSSDSHSDIRLLIMELTTRLNTLANSEDVDLDQMAELVAYIKSNRGLIEEITTNKINVTDIVNNLTTNVANKPLSASQGVALKALIDAIKIPDITGKADKATTLAGYGITDGATKAEVSQLSEEIDDLSLGMGEDGRIYLLRNGVAQGNGIELPSGASGDVVGNIGENNIIVLSGDIPDATYTLVFEKEDGTIIDIGNMVLDSNVYYSITKNLTNCTISNNATSIVEGEGYSATITANDGYELSSVTVTMGGNDVTVTDGIISIAEVTGNIVITAEAEEISVEPVTENITLTDGLSIVTASGADRTISGYCATPHIDVSNIPKPCVIELKKALWAYTESSATGYTRCYITDKNGNKLVGDYTHSSKMPSGVTMEYNDNVVTDVTITVTSDNIGTLRFAGQWTGNHSDSNDRFADSNTSATLTYTPN